LFCASVTELSVPILICWGSSPPVVFLYASSAPFTRSLPGCGGLEQLARLGADRVAHLRAVEADERRLLAAAVLDGVVRGHQRDARVLGRADHLGADLLVGHHDHDAVDLLRDHVVELADRLVGVRAEVDHLDVDVAELLRLLLGARRLVHEVLLVTLLLQQGDGELAGLGRRTAAAGSRTGVLAAGTRGDQARDRRRGRCRTQR
jgi:hypothetical protein